VFHLFEEWQSTAHFQQHTNSTNAQAVLARLGEFGIAGLQTGLYNVADVDGQPSKQAAAAHPTEQLNHHPQYGGRS
jgi:hypothetical protein